jgi:hypothetical protein
MKYDLTQYTSESHWDKIMVGVYQKVFKDEFK